MVPLEQLDGGAPDGVSGTGADRSRGYVLKEGLYVAVVAGDIRRPVDGVGNNELHQPVHAFPGGRHRGHHRHHEGLLQAIDVDVVSLPRLVHEVKGHDHPVAQLDQLEQQHQPLLQPGGVQYGDYVVRSLFRQELGGHQLVLGLPRQGVDAREVVDEDILSVEGHRGLLEGDRCTWVVCGYYPDARDAAEELGLTNVEVAGQKDLQLSTSEPSPGRHSRVPRPPSAPRAVPTGDLPWALFPRGPPSGRERTPWISTSLSSWSHRR
ncbi:MAG: hypothetical protein A4E29_00072 [Methanomassiliicoccales archaeon PtaB.Bin134]|nr:MAG: hypothetical protein A4E29_00072 [Methanomassiliicoccales archaeon PtaB.Bin134]